jgi:hypothetical protein
VSGRSLVRAAARNNAAWCHAFARTHGIAGRFQAAFWSSPVRTPAYYPDAVTLRPNFAVESLLFGIDAGEGCSVKDSFACLDLGAAGSDRCSEPSGRSGSMRRVVAPPVEDGWR